MASCAIYVRQSMDRSEGIDRQLAKCRALAVQRGWEVLDEYEDNSVSAFKSRGKGTAWARLLDSPADVVVAVNLDRLLRGQADLLTIIATGKTVATVEGDLDLTTADGRFRAELLTSLATFETNRRRERQTRANEYRITNGFPVPGRRRFGFEEGNVIERPDEADRVREAFARILNGGSIRGLAKEWGVSNRRIRDTLANPTYAGWVIRRGERFEAHESVARVVDRDTWTAVQDLLADEARRITTGPGRRHLLSGIARCVCGVKMHAMGSYYRCSTGEAHSSIRRTQLDTLVTFRLAVELMQDDGKRTMDELGPIAARLRELEDERSRWTAVAALPGADLPQITRELARIATEAEEVSAELGQARLKDHHALLVEDAMAALQVMQAVGADDEGMLDLDLREFALYFDALDLDLRRALVDAKLTVTVANRNDEERVTINPR